MLAGRLTTLPYKFGEKVTREKGCYLFLKSDVYTLFEELEWIITNIVKVNYDRTTERKFIFHIVRLLRTLYNSIIISL